jgi:hypothetical protein
MTLNAVSTGAAPETFAPPTLTLDAIPADTKLARRQAAKALTCCGIPLSEKTLSTKASRGGGPPYQLFGKIALYTWGTLVAWTLDEMGKPARSASEHRIKAASPMREKRNPATATAGLDGARRPARRASPVALED